MYLKPAPGLIVRDPNTRQPLPAEGREVQLTDWWARRLRAGDVVEVQPALSAPIDFTPTEVDP